MLGQSHPYPLLPMGRTHPHGNQPRTPSALRFVDIRANHSDPFTRVLRHEQDALLTGGAGIPVRLWLSHCLRE